MQPEDIQSLIQYWKACLARLDSDDDKQVAYDIIGSIIATPLWDEYYEVDEPDADIVAVFDAAADLELPNNIHVGTDENRKIMWVSIKKHVQRLERRYLVKNR